MDKQIKLSDYTVDFIAKLGVETLFLVSGGGCIHLVDSVGNNKKIKYICNYNEQASAIASEAYSRINENIGVCIVTTGPGSTNALTGLIGAWLDSIPTLFISGQVKTETIADYSKLRQLGDQEINIIDIVKPVTKFAKTINNANDIDYYLSKAIFLSKNGRPGPVWLNIPLDIQGKYITKKQLKKFYPPVKNITTRNKYINRSTNKIIKKLSRSKRPVLLVGNGTRLSGAQKEVLELIKLLKIPVVTSFVGQDIVSTNNKYFSGRPGTVGQRSANFVVQNSDLLLILGSRLNIRLIGYNFPSYAREAYKIMVDIDKEEMNKKTITIDMKVNSDIKSLVTELNKKLKKKPIELNINPWLDKVSSWKTKYPNVLPEYWNEKKNVNPYCFIETLSNSLKPSDVLALTNATASICTYQAIRFPQGTRILTNSGCAAMGYGLPAAIGSYMVNKKSRVICLEGDGSLQMNIQELQTIKHNKLPIKIFVINNKGYLSIRLTQNSFFKGNYVASSNDSGVSCPDYTKIAKAYGIKAVKILNNNQLPKKVKDVLNSKGPVICEVVVSPNMQFLPKASSMKLPNGSFVSRPLEDMYPFLSRKELKDNLLIKPWGK